MATDNEKLEMAMQAVANAGPRKVEQRLRILDVKDKLREDRRRQRLLEKGY